MYPHRFAREYNGSLAKGSALWNPSEESEVKYATTIKLRLTPEQEASYKAAAGDRRMSSWLRSIADDAVAVVNNDVVDYAGIRRALLDIRRDLTSGIGNNLNQIAEHLNAGRGANNSEIDAALADIAEAKSMINAVLTRLDRR